MGSAGAALGSDSKNMLARSTCHRLRITAQYAIPLRAHA
jgi:hypothetical protein